MTASFSIARILLVPVLVAGALSLAGCGRKAEPELPRATTAPAEARPVGIPIGPTPVETETRPTRKKSFLLDPLL